MHSAEPLPRCVVIVLAGDAPVQAEWIERFVKSTCADAPVEMFCARDGAAADDPRLRWHEPRANLADAIDALGLKATGTDLAFAIAGTEVPLGWDVRLQASLHCTALAASASPLCVGDPTLAPLDDRRLPATAMVGGPGPVAAADTAELDAMARDTRAIDPVQVAAPLRWCGVLRAAAVEAVRGRGADWPRAIEASGFAHVACMAVIVSPPAGATGTSPTIEPSTLLAPEAPGSPDALREARVALAAQLRAPRATASAAREVPQRRARLHVAHSWGGGLGAWARDFTAGDRDHDGLILRSTGVIGAYGQRLWLTRGDDPATPLLSWTLDPPIRATATAHLGYVAILDEIRDTYALDSVIVSSLIGHSLDALRTGLPTVLVAHDHYPFCVAIFAHFGGECRSCDADRLATCMASNPAHRFFREVRAADWLALRHAFVDVVRGRSIPVVAPSASTASRWRDLMPDLAQTRFEVIGHGIDLPPPVPWDPPTEGKLRLVTLGRLDPEKGGELLEAALGDLLRVADLTLLGCGEAAMRLARIPGVRAVAAFSRDELPRLIAEARPHAGLQLSVVPETFSYTLSEMWHFGVPVLGLRTGSLGERIREGENGWLCEPDARALVRAVREIDAARGSITELRERLRAASTRSVEQMVADYRAVLPPPDPRRVLVRRAETAGGATRLRLGSVSIDPQARYADAARGFVRYTLHKAANSPRLPRALRKLFAAAARRHDGTPH